MTRRRSIETSSVSRSRALKLVPIPAERVVSLTRVARARRRIASGWYDRADVRKSLVDAVLHEIRGR